MRLEKAPIARIRVPTRHRRHMGDLQRLADSIAGPAGLIHPIVLSEDYELLAGQRRLKACELLGWKEIEAKIIVIADPLQLEHDENEIRKDFTASERTAIADAFAKRLGNRQGQRTDIAAQELRHNCAEVEPGERTRTTAAKAAGFGSHEEYRRAKKVTEDGVEELVEAMDTEEIPISTAAETASLFPEAQREVVEKVKRGRKPRKALEEVKESERIKRDGSRAPVPPALAEVFGGRTAFAEAQKALDSLAKSLALLAGSPAGAKLRKCFRGHQRGHNLEYSSIHLRELKSLLKDSEPHLASCPHCAGRARAGDVCKVCAGDGWLSWGEWKKARKSASAAAPGANSDA